MLRMSASSWSAMRWPVRSMRRGTWVRFLALFGLQPRRHRLYRRTRTYVAIGPASSGWPAWLPQGDRIIRASSLPVEGQAPVGDEVWLIQTKRTPRELCEHARNVVEWLAER